MLSSTIRGYAAAIVLAIIFFIIVSLVIYKYGEKLIIALWSFPLLIISILFLAGPNSQSDGCNSKISRKLDDESLRMARFVLAYTILVIALIAAYLFSIRFRSRFLAFMAALAIWLILSIIIMRFSSWQESESKINK